MNYSLNIPLLRQIPESTSKGIVKTLRTINVNYNTWCNRTEDEQVNGYFTGPSLEQVLRLCNLIRIPVRYLFTVEGELDIPPIAEELSLPIDSFKPCSFDWKLFRQHFGISGMLCKSAAEIMRLMGMSKKPYFNWFEDHETLRIPALLLFCRTFELDLFSFIIDPNNPASNTDNLVNEEDDNLSVEEQLKKELQQIKEYSDAIKIENDELKKENNALKSDNIRLTNELMEAQHENTLLRKQLNKGAKLYNLDLDEPSKLIAAEDVRVGYGNKNEDKDLV